jgi:hypothetical protein
VTVGVTVDQVTVDAGGTLVLAPASGAFGVANGSGTDLVVNGSLQHNTGAFTIGAGAVVGGSGSVSINGGLLYIWDVNGISSSGAVGPIQNTGPRTFGSSASYSYNSLPSSGVTGSGLPASILTLASPGAAGITVTLSQDLTCNGGPPYSYALYTYTGGAFRSGRTRSR